MARVDLPIGLGRTLLTRLALGWGLGLGLGLRLEGSGFSLGCVLPLTPFWALPDFQLLHQLSDKKEMSAKFIQRNAEFQEPNASK